MAETYIEGLTGGPLKKFFRLLALEKEDIALVYVYAVVSGFISLSLPLGIQAIMSLVTAARVSSSLIVLIVVVLLGIVISSGMQIMQYTIIERLQQRIFTRATFEFAYRIPRIKLESLIKEYAPELMNRFFDIMTIQKGLPKLIVDLSASLLQILFSLILLAFYHPIFAFYGVLVVVVIIVLFRFTAEKGLETSLKESKYKYMVAHWLEELSRSMNIFKLAGYTDMPINHTDDLVSNYLDARQKHFKVLITQYRYIVLFKLLITGGLLIIGSALVVNKQINLGQFVASEIIIILILNSVEKLFSGIETIYDVLTGVEKISNVTQKEIESEAGLSFEEVDNGKGVKIEFRNVSYGYAINQHTALKNLNLVVESGQKICVAGFAASGCSTLINLSASLLHDYEGTILVNDVMLKNMNLMSLRSYVGENLTQNEIMNGTITENISMGRDDISFKDVLEASEIVGLKRFVEGFPKGFDTHIVQNDITVPFSIAAKINLARSVAEKPRLFVMDQPLQHLDKKDKESISEFLTGKDKPWTLIVATNDIAMAKRCDKIVVLQEGKVIDEGTFEEISNKPYSSELFET